MLYALGRYEECLQYYNGDGDTHIVVCKTSHEYLSDFLLLLNQSVSTHPYPGHTQVSKDRLNDEGIPIFEYILMLILMSLDIEHIMVLVMNWVLAYVKL
jgi:hypothetical protein